MTVGLLASEADWAGVRLVAFDVDGTLYRQAPLRLYMAAELALHAVRSCDVTTIRVLSRYRRIRERMGEAETADFLPALVTETARTCGVAEEQVRSVVAEWIERRPLRHLAGCRYPRLPELFAALRRKGKSVGILSDYPVAAKLQALGLTADHAVCAEDPDIGVLKPHPKGLLALIDAAGATPRATVLIGDRPDRDGLAAQRAGARALIRASHPVDGWQTFTRFDDAPFRPLLAD